MNDTINLYGMNYTHLAKNYQGDPTYFDGQVHEITYNLLLNGKMQAAGGDVYKRQESMCPRPTMPPV